MRNKKGFTLIELLAVIVILAIILAIAIPGISGIVKSSTKSSMNSDAKLVLKSIDLKKLSDKDFNPIDYNSNLEGLLSALKLSGDNYESIIFTINNEKTLVTIEGKGKWAGFTACGSYHNMNVSEEGCELDLIPPVITLNGDSTISIEQGETYDELGATVTDNSGEELEIVMTGSVNTSVAGEYKITYTTIDSSGNRTTMTRTVTVTLPSYAGPKYIPSKGVNGPLLTNRGMTPIKRSGDTWVDTDIYDPDWYEYGTTTETRRWANVRTNDCTTPGDIETCSMWVWIPRYAYQITSGYHTATAGTIDIRFLQGTTNTTSDSTQIYEDSATNTHFVKHPAFNFGGVEITGMWIAKFEHTGSTDSLGSKPGVDSIRNVQIDNMFWASRNMETNDTYGWGLASDLNASSGDFATNTNNVDAHMIKNTEWGMVLYLAQSAYGKNSMITASGSSKTGGGEGIAYVTNVGQSTTGTIYGIYDIAGGATEYVMGNWDRRRGASGFVTVSNRIVLNGKYYKLYPYSNDYKAAHYGDAIFETSSWASTGTPPPYSWYGGSSILISNGYPWYVRGGAGGFSFSEYGGYAHASYGWRSVVLVSTGL